MRECWRKIDATFDAVLREANLEAFSRIRNYVEETFRKRAEDSEAFGKSQNKDDGIDHSNTSRNRLPPHFAESLPGRVKTKMME